MLLWKPSIPENIQNLVPYPPGKPIEETKREFNISEVIKLASNENPFGPSPLALQAIQNSMNELHRYPDGSHFVLKKKLSEVLNVEMNQINIGNGSNEFIDLLIRVFVPADCNIVTQEKAFVAYGLCAQLQGCGCHEAKVDENFKPSVESILAAVNENTKLVFLANPNNPTGTFLNQNEIERLANSLNEKKILFVLDYAYWEYVTESSIPDPITLLRKFQNIIILKTFSKIYGLAGLRVGYMISDSTVASIIEKARQPFNINSLALEAASAALDDDEFVKHAKEMNSDSIEELLVELPKMGIKAYPSQGNFVLADFGIQSKELYPAFLSQGVILRPVTNYGLPTFFRISAGTTKENQKLFQVLRSRLK